MASASEHGGDVVTEAERIAMIRTRVLLARLQGEQERLAAAFAASGLSSFSARVDFLIDRWTPDERDAWRLRWLELGIEPEPLWRPAWEFAWALTPPPPRRQRRVKRPPVISPERQLEIAIAVLDARDAEERERLGAAGAVA